MRHENINDVLSMVLITHSIKVSAIEIISRYITLTLVNPILGYSLLVRNIDLHLFYVSDLFHPILYKAARLIQIKNIFTK